MTQRELLLTQLNATRASGAVGLIRFYVGLIFVGDSLDARMSRSEAAPLAAGAAV
jgi:hypothetical protein